MKFFALLISIVFVVIMWLSFDFNKYSFDFQNLQVFYDLPSPLLVLIPVGTMALLTKPKTNGKLTKPSTLSPEEIHAWQYYFNGLGALSHYMGILGTLVGFVYASFIFGILG